MSYALGIICYGRHEAAAVLIDGGRVVAAAEEERFSRQKFDPGFPTQAIAFCLRQARISAADLVAIGYGFDPRRRLLAKAGYMARRFPASLALLNGGGTLLRRMDRIEQDIRERLDFTGPIYRLNHHLCHAASAFYASPFTEAAILTLDGAGDWESGWWGQGAGERISESGRIDWPQSLGHVYAAFTEYLGFQAFSDEYKVMGLAAYGTPHHLAQMSEIFWPTAGGYQVDLDYFEFHKGRSPRYGSRLVERFGPPLRDPESHVPQHYRDVAASLQAQLERVVSHLVRQVTRATGLRRLCLSGGVAMNSVANGKLLNEGLVDALYIPPCASDAGVALGAAYLSHLKATGQLRRHELTTAALGPEYDDAPILDACAKHGLIAHLVTDPAESAAQLLAEGQIIGWFQGRMEFGQRALGARSILADPRRAEMKDVVNAKIKFRESFRPFAPSVLAEHAVNYFHCQGPSPFMTQVSLVREEKRQVIPAVTHVDGTARVQTVERAASPLYWNLIDAFYRLTSVPVVLNTSFNIKGQPIVNTPAEAVETFMQTSLDALICGSYLILKPAPPNADQA